MTIIEILHTFCGDNILEEPWTDGEWTCASEGHIALRVPRVDTITKPQPVELQNDFPWQPDIDGEWVKIPEYKIPRKIKCKSCLGTGHVATCPECDGEGGVTFENGFHEYDFECLTCYGTGVVKGEGVECKECGGTGLVYPVKSIQVKFADIIVNGFLLEKLKQLDGIMLFSVSRDDLCWFKFAQGHGVFMAMRA